MTGNWGVPLAVIGLVVLLLVMAGLVKRYQIHLATIRENVRRLEAPLPALRVALDNLSGVPLSRELRVMLRNDELARHQAVQRLVPKHPQIARQISETRARRDAEGPKPDLGIRSVESEQDLRRLLDAIDHVHDYIASGAPLPHLRAEESKVFREELGERRAEILSRFHLVAASRLLDANDTSHARQHVNTLMHTLRDRGPNTEFIRQLYGEAEHMLHDINIPNTTPAATADPAHPEQVAS